MKIGLYKSPMYEEYKKLIKSDDILVDDYLESDVVVITPYDMKNYTMPYAIDHPIMLLDEYLGK